MTQDTPNKIGIVAEHLSPINPPMGREGFAVGQKVTARSIAAKAILLGQPQMLELANYPSLIGIPLTIVDFEDPWIICTRASGSYAPALLVEDLELWGGTQNV